MYKLLLKRRDIIGAKWQTADFGADAPSMNYEINDIAEVENRQANYSQRLTLPLTPNNRRIFDHIDAPQAVTTIQYETLDARLFYDSTELVGRGGQCKVLQVNERTVEVCVLSGIKDVFEELEAVNFENGDNVFGNCRLPLDINEARTWNEEISAQRENPNSTPIHYIYAEYANGYIDDNKIGHTNFTQTDNISQSALPLVQLFSDWGTNKQCGIIPAVFNHIGYKVDTNIDLAATRKIYASLCDKKNNNDSAIVCKNELIFNGNENVDGLGKTTVLYTGQQRDIIHNSKYVIKATCKVEVEYFGYCFEPIDVSFDIGDKKLSLYFENGDEQHPDDPDWEHFGWEYKGADTEFPWYEKTLYSNTIDAKDLTLNAISKCVLYTRLNTRRETPSFLYNIKIELLAVEDYETDIAAAGGRINIGMSLGWNNGKEAVKTICQLFCLTPMVDYHNKKIYLYNLSKLYENKAIAVDWSDKLQPNTKRTYSFGGYGQTNIISFEENAATNFVDSGSFDIANPQLEPSKELFKIGFESGQGATIEQANDRGEFKKSKKPHLVEAVARDQDKAQWVVSNHYPAQAFVDTYYQDLQRMLNRALVLDCELYLTPEDIEQLDFMRPVFLRQYGRYFYINAIKDFRVGKLTEATLVAL